MNDFKSRIVLLLNSETFLLLALCGGKWRFSAERGLSLRLEEP